MVMFAIFAGVLVLLLLGVTTAVTMGFASIATFLMAGGDMARLFLVPQRMFSQVSGITLMSIPFFLLMGNLMSVGGISKSLFGFGRVCLGHRAGGLSNAAIVACIVMAAMSGSAAACAAGIGMIAIAEMTKSGYDRAFSCATIAAGGVRIMAGGIRAVGLAVRANPLGLLITGMMVLYSTCEPVRAAFDAVFGYIGGIISSVWEKIKGFGDTLKSLGKWAGFGGDEEEEASPPDSVVPPAKAAVPGLESVTPLPALMPFPQTALSSMPENMPSWNGMPANSQGNAGSILADYQNNAAGQAPSPGTDMAASSVTANFSFQMNGIPDRDFAERVVQAIQERRSEFEQLLDRIVRDQQRAAYGI